MSDPAEIHRPSAAEGRLVQAGFNLEANTTIGRTPTEVRAALARFVPAGDKIRREDLLQKISEHWGLPLKQTRPVLNRILNEERHTGRLQVDATWENVWQTPK